MPLTPEDVQNKTFETVRLREGYDMDEVDDFLDEVQAELERLLRENDELREKLAAVTRGGSLLSSAEAQRADGPKPPPSAAVQPAQSQPNAAANQPSDAAAKVLALAQKTADELVADAKTEADRLLSDARQRADKIDSEIKAKVSKIEQEARQRAEQVEQEAAQRRQEVFAQLEADCARLERQRDQLRDFEREYRSRLKAYLQAELRKLETGAVDEASAPAPQAAESGPQNQQSPQPPQPPQNSNNAVTAGGGTNSGSLRSVASLLEDDQH